MQESANEVEILYKKERLLLPRGDIILLPIANTSTELLAEYIAGQIKRKVRQNFLATIRYMEVAVEEARGQRGIFRDEFNGSRLAMLLRSGNSPADMLVEMDVRELSFSKGQGIAQFDRC